VDEASRIIAYAPADYEPADDHHWLLSRRVVLRISWSPTNPAWGRSASLIDPVTHAIRWYYVARHLDRRPTETLAIWYCGRRSVVIRRVRRPRGVCPDCVAAIVRSQRVIQWTL